METIGLGQILALAGFIMLLLAGVGRQQARRQRRPPSPKFLLWQRWGTYAAFALLLAGLLLMARAK